MVNFKYALFLSFAEWIAVMSMTNPVGQQVATQAMATARQKGRGPKSL
jgi:hypothetical protein